MRQDLISVERSSLCSYSFTGFFLIFFIHNLLLLFGSFFGFFSPVPFLSHLSPHPLLCLPPSVFLFILGVWFFIFLFSLYHMVVHVL